MNCPGISKKTGCGGSIGERASIRFRLGMTYCSSPQARLLSTSMNESGETTKSNCGARYCTTAAQSDCERHRVPTLQAMDDSTINLSRLMRFVVTNSCYSLMMSTKPEVGLTVG